MASPFAYAGAGLLQGLGKGIAAEGKRKREEALRRMEREYQAKRDQENRQFQRGLLTQRQDFQAEQAALNREQQSGQYVGNFTNQQGEVVGITRGGATNVLGTAYQEPKDPKEPKLYEVYDEETGRKQKVAWDSETNAFVPVGGTAAPGADGDGRKPFEFEAKRDALIEVGYDPKEATEIATGRKEVNPQEVRQKAIEMVSGNDMLKPEEKQAEADRITSYILEGSQQPQASGGGQGGNTQGGGRGTASAGEGGGVGSRMLSLPRMTDPFGLFGGGSGEQKDTAEPQAQPRPQSGSDGGALTPKSQRGQQPSQSERPSQGQQQQSQQPAAQAPQSPQDVKRMDFKALQSFVENASSDELSALPMSVRSEIAKRLRGGE